MLVVRRALGVVVVLLHSTGAVASVLFAACPSAPVPPHPTIPHHHPPAPLRGDGWTTRNVFGIPHPDARFATPQTPGKRATALDCLRSPWLTSPDDDPLPDPAEASVTACASPSKDGDGGDKADKAGGRGGRGGQGAADDDEE